MRVRQPDRPLIAAALATLLALLLAACGTSAPTADAPTAAAPTAAATAQGDAHGSASGDSSLPYDARFIDSMIAHHQGAISMATKAIQDAQHTELKVLGQQIITSQTAEVARMQEWRQQWYPSLPPTQGLGMHMGDMEISADASVPFDLRFISAMIAHHEGAISMAKDAQQHADHPEIKELAGAIIAAQEVENIQLQQWQKEWGGQ